jgi:hypothetical protein
LERLRGGAILLGLIVSLSVVALLHLAFRSLMFSPGSDAYLFQLALPSLLFVAAGVAASMQLVAESNTVDG